MTNPDPKTQALVQDVLAEMEWLARHQDWESFPQLVAQRYTHYFALGTRLRDEDLRVFAVDLALAQGFTDAQVLGFFSIAAQLFVGLGMIGAQTTMVEQLALRNLDRDRLQ